jgi:protein-S-isoprenylcysteine O-methyltransferase Ste14
MKSLVVRAWLGVIFLAVATGLLLFVPAGTIHYWQAWVYLAIFIGISAITTLYLQKTDPALLERRLRAGARAEKRPAQRRIMLGTQIGFFFLLLIPALDHRFGWSSVPTPIILTGDALVAIGLALIIPVYRANTFASATIQIAENQTIISTGPYAVVRHPMYASSLPYLLGTPLALGSWWGLLPLAAVPPLLIWRLLDEERMLAKELPGYTEYQKRVRYRLVPGVW